MPRSLLLAVASTVVLAAGARAQQPGPTPPRVDAAVAGRIPPTTVPPRAQGSAAGHPAPATRARRTPAAPRAGTTPVRLDSTRASATPDRRRP